MQKIRRAPAGGGRRDVDDLANLLSHHLRETLLAQPIIYESLPQSSAWFH